MKDNRIKLTSEEYNLLNNITSQTKTDCWFKLDVDENGFDYVEDLENGDYLTLHDAIDQLNDAIIPELLVVTREDMEIYAKLLEKLGITENPFEEEM